MNDDKKYRILATGKIKRITWENWQEFTYYKPGDKTIRPDCFLVECEAGLFLVEADRPMIYHGVGYVMTGGAKTRGTEHPVVIADDILVSSCYKAALEHHEGERAGVVGEELAVKTPEEARGFLVGFDDSHPGQTRKSIVEDSTALSPEETALLSI